MFEFKCLYVCIPACECSYACVCHWARALQTCIWLSAQQWDKGFDNPGNGSQREQTRLTPWVLSPRQCSDQAGKQAEKSLWVPCKTCQGPWLLLTERAFNWFRTCVIITHGALRYASSTQWQCVASEELVMIYSGLWAGLNVTLYDIMRFICSLEKTL